MFIVIQLHKSINNARIEYEYPAILYGYLGVGSFVL